jgi:hypothetical protein
VSYYGDGGTRFRARGRMYLGDGLFSRFSFKKLFRAAGKVVKPLAKLAAPVLSMVPGGQFVSGLLGGAKGVVQAARQTIEPFAPVLSAIHDVAGGQLPGAGVARAMAGAAGLGTPGGIAAVSERTRTVRRAKRYTYRRPARRRRR